MDEKTKQLLALGREHYEKREFDKAEHFLRQVTARGVSYADVANMLGVICHDRGRFEEAKAAFEEALSLNPKYTEAALNLAVTYNDLGRYDDAKSVYRSALARGDVGSGQLDPFAKGKIANLHGQLAQAYVDAGLMAEAMHELRKAVVLCPEFADLRMRLAALYREQGDAQAAHYELEEAVRARPTYVPARVAFGVVKLSLGDTRGAIAEWESALELEPQNRTIEMYLRMARAPATDPAPRG